MKNSYKKSSDPIARMVLLFLLLGLCIIAFAMAKGLVSIMIALMAFILFVYYSIFKNIEKDSVEGSVLCDGRFYIFSAILMYTIIPPIYGLLTLDENGGVRMRNAYGALTYSEEELLKTLVMSALFFLGMWIGIVLRKGSRSVRFSGYKTSHDVFTGKALFGWGVICLVSTFDYLLPFLQGGFSIIRSGGTILDVTDTGFADSSSMLGKIMDIFFSPEIMVVSTVAVVYYLFYSNMSSKLKNFLLVILITLEIIFSYLSTRRARMVAIILCAFIIYITEYKKKKNKLPMRTIGVVGAAFVILYSLDIILGRATYGNLASYFSLFDGVPAYDSLLLASRSTPTPSMLTNMVYGLFRPIPFLGKYIVSFMGIDNSAPPMYLWMAERYTTYQHGGGLAYTPQQEAYLCAGFIGCLLFGILYGYMFGKRRNGLRNLFLAAMAFSIARGNMYVVLSLMWPYEIVGYWFYDRFLFRSVTFGHANRGRIQDEYVSRAYQEKT